MDIWEAVGEDLSEGRYAVVLEYDDGEVEVICVTDDLHRAELVYNRRSHYRPGEFECIQSVPQIWLLDKQEGSDVDNMTVEVEY